MRDQRFFLIHGSMNIMVYGVRSRGFSRMNSQGLINGKKLTRKTKSIQPCSESTIPSSTLRSHIFLSGKKGNNGKNMRQEAPRSGDKPKKVYLSSPLTIRPDWTHLFILISTTAVAFMIYSSSITETQQQESIDLSGPIEEAWLDR